MTANAKPYSLGTRTVTSPNTCDATTSSFFSVDDDDNTEFSCTNSQSDVPFSVTEPVYEWDVGCYSSG